MNVKAAPNGWMFVWGGGGEGMEGRNGSSTAQSGKVAKGLWVKRQNQERENECVEGDEVLNGRTCCHRGGESRNGHRRVEVAPLRANFGCCPVNPFNVLCVCGLRWQREESHEITKKTVCAGTKVG